MKYLGLEVESLEVSMHVNSPLGTRVSVDQMCWDYELEILGILLIMGLRVMDMSEFGVILGMNWLTARRVVIDCDRKRVTAYTPNDVCVMFQGDKHDTLPRAVNDSRWQGQLVGWLASLTLEEKMRQELGLPRVVCEYENIFSDELPGLPPHRVVDFAIELHLGISPISMTLHRMVPVEL